jgi:hypothetical protein
MAAITISQLAHGKKALGQHARILAVDKVIPVAQHRGLTLKDAPEGALEIHKALQRWSKAAVEARRQVMRRTAGSDARKALRRDQLYRLTRRSYRCRQSRRAQVVHVQTEVNGGAFNVAMPQGVADGLDADALVHEPGRKGMPQHMRCEWG